MRAFHTHITSCQRLGVIPVLALSLMACGDIPTQPAVEIPSMAAVVDFQRRHGIERSYMEIQRRAPGFAGIRLVHDTLYVYRTAGAADARITDAIDGLLGADPQIARSPRAFRVAQYDFNSMASWRDQLTRLMGDPRLVLIAPEHGLDEISVGVTSADVFADVTEAARTIGIPDGVVNIVFMEPFEYEQTFSHSVGPLSQAC